MKTKTKKSILKILKISWKLIGIAILIWTIFWFIKVKIMHEYQFVRNVIYFVLGLYGLMLYCIIWLFSLIIKNIKRKWKPKK